MSKKVPGKKKVPGEQNTEAQEEKRRVDDALAKPGKYEVKQDDTFRIEFTVRKSGDRWVVVGDPSDKAQDEEAHWVEFRMWTYEEDVTAKKNATMYDEKRRIHFIDHDLLNRFKVQALLRSWSFSEGNPRLKLLHVNGVLCDEGWEAFSRLYPSIIRHIIERLNDVLEFNG